MSEIDEYVCYVVVVVDVGYCFEIVFDEVFFGFCLICGFIGVFEELLGFGFVVCVV